MKLQKLIYLFVLGAVRAGMWIGRGNRKPRRFDITIGVPSRKEKAVLTVSITNEQKVKITVAPATEAGKPAELDGDVSFSVISGGASVERVDARSAYLVSGDSPGDSEILVEADADLGEGVQTISDIIKLTVVGALAANLGLSASAPELK